MSPTDLAAIRALIALRRAGFLAGVWCDAGRLRVQLPDGSAFGARPGRYHRVLAAVKERIAERKAAA